jgi:hypothetical protein
MDLSTYKQMPDLPNADINFLDDLDDTLLGRPLEDYLCEENMEIERQRIENDMDLWDSEKIAQYESDMIYKSRCGVWA